MKLLFCAFIQDLTFVASQTQAINFCLYTAVLNRWGFFEPSHFQQIAAIQSYITFITTTLENSAFNVSLTIFELK